MCLDKPEAVLRKAWHEWTMRVSINQMMIEPPCVLELIAVLAYSVQTQIYTPACPHESS